MTIRDASGNILTKTELIAAGTLQAAAQNRYKLNQPIYQTYPLSGEKSFESGRRLLWRSGKIVTQADIDALYKAAAVTSVSPATGPTAGGATVTVNGSNLGGVEGVTFGGTAATAVTVLSESQVRCVTPAKSAGAVNVVVADDSGTATLTNGYTYA